VYVRFSNGTVELVPPNDAKLLVEASRAPVLEASIEKST
jgi:hypothetical protein